RFVREIPGEFLIVENSVRGAVPVSDRPGGGARAYGASESRVAPALHIRPNPNDASVGRRVQHDKFGRGRVVAAEGAGMDKRFLIEFHDGETRKILGRFLTGLDDD